MMNEIFLGLGSNIGDRAENIVSALSFLQSCGFVEIIKVSSLYETAPVGYKQRNFYNAAVKACTNLNPQDLLALIKQAESLLGRKPAKRWSARVIDIDILFYGNKIIYKKDESGIWNEKENRKCRNKNSSILRRYSGLPLTIPHKEICSRLFVLIPLCEIAPQFEHPVLNKTMEAVLKDNSLTLVKQKVKIIKL